MKKNKIFVCSPNISNYYENLSHGFEQLGYDVFSYYLSNNKYESSAKIHSSILTLGDGIYSLIISIHPKFGKVARMGQQIFRVIWILRYQFKYKYYIFGFGESLLYKNLDLLLFKLMRKKVVMVMGHGSESRPPYIDGAQYSTISLNSDPLKALKDKTNEKFVNLRRIQSITPNVVGHPNNFQFSNKKFINIQYLGQPITTQEVEKAQNLRNESDKKPFKVIHAPSDPIGKGTDEIRSVIIELGKTYEIEYTELNNVPHLTVMDTLREADLVVDQVYADAPTSGFSLEASSLGVPSVIAGYFKNISSNDEILYPPVIQCRPGELLITISEVLKSRANMESLGFKAHLFTKERLAPKKVATRFEMILKGQTPAHWWMEPQEVTYCLGYGQSEERSREIINALTTKYGVKALKLSHNPELEYIFTTFFLEEG
jgi:hypothetical protein